MKPKIKKIILSLIIVCAVAMAGVEFFSIDKKSTEEWQPLNSIQEYSQIFDQPITQIKLREVIDSWEWVEFEDEDLIEQWSFFLKSLKVKREWVFLDPTPTDGGGGLIANMETGEEKFFIWLVPEGDHYELESGGYRYIVKSDQESPFEEIYQTAEERHGVRTPKS